MSVLKTNTSKQNLIHWSIVVVLFVFSLIAGTIGFQHYFSELTEPSEGLRPLYRTIQLFTMEGGDFDKTMNGEAPDKPIPWILLVVRITAPLTTFMAVILALIEIFRKQLKRLRISWLRKHVVIIGLGTKGK